MNLFLDTEFTELSSHPIFISVGLVSEDGKCSFYAEFIDHFSLQNCNDFVHRNVLPLLDAVLLSDQLDRKNIYAKMKMHECRAQLLEWIELFSEPIQIWSDAPHYDWIFIHELFSGHDWPGNLLPLPKWILSGDDLDIERFKSMRETLYINGDYRRHHALDDACVNQKAWISLRNSKISNR